MTKRIPKKIGILGTGNMGSAIARSLHGAGLQTLTCLAGRSERSKELASAAEMTQVPDLESLVTEADILLSIIPPAAAVEFARELLPLIRDTGGGTLFVDCNAVAPATVAGIARQAEDLDVDFQDAGIVGAAPGSGRLPVRLYTSGPWNDAMRGLATELIEIKPLGERIGRASALKMTYASLTKGTQALRAAAFLAGERLGIGPEIRAEWQRSVPDAFESVQNRLHVAFGRSGRWTGEMREIAETFDSVGLSPSFHEGAEWMYALMSRTLHAARSNGTAQDERLSVEEILEALSKELDSSPQRG